MIIQINKNDLTELENSFIDLEWLKKEIIINPFARIIVLKENHIIIGYIYYSDIYERVEINQFEINPIHRNCGYGSLLLKKLIELVDKDITLEVRSDNIPAITIYRRAGFKKVATRKGYYKGIDGILMERIKK